MADSLNKDVVAARIALDTSKIAQAFQTVDQGVQRNAQSFKVLNAELQLTERSYNTLATAMNKTALTSEERRKKILDESKSLVELRKAQAEFIQVRTQALDKANEITDQKLKAQEAIVKRRNDAIEQQEREHQKRMEALNIRASEASSRDNLQQVRLDREFQQIRNAQLRIEQQTTEHFARMERINNNSGIPLSTPAVSNTLLDQLKNAAIHAAVFSTVYRSIHVAQEALKEGLVDIEANMAGYVQTNEAYFVSFEEGTHKMVMNTERLREETSKFIGTAHSLGAEIGDVTESARLWGRMYKDVGIVQELVRQSTKLSTVDMVELEAATKGMESVLAQYGAQIRNVNDAMVIGNRILDSWSKVAHDTMAPAKELAAAFERTGKIADETGVSFDVMNGLVSSGIRNTALGGANLGNMWKTVLGTIRTDKAVQEIENLGVATKEVVDGKEQWRRADEILIDLATKVIDKNYDLTQSYADISRGVYQYAKLAASLNVGDILLGTAASIGSTGSTLEYLKVQMDTIQRKAAQTRASLLEIFNKAGDDGVRSAIKKSLDILDQLLIGITKIPKGVITATVSLGGLFAIYKLAAPLLTQWKAAQEALNTATRMHIALQTVATEEMVIYTAAARNAMLVTAAWTAGLSLLAAGIAMYVFQSGRAEKADRERIQAMKDAESASQQRISQYERQIDLLPKLVNAHNSLQSALDSGTLSNEKQAKVKKQLGDISHALAITLGEEGAAHLEAANYTDEAVKVQVAALDELISKQREAMRNTLIDQENEITKQIEKKQNELTKAQDELRKAQLLAAGATADTTIGLAYLVRLDDAKKKVEKLTPEFNELNTALYDVKVRLGELGVEDAKNQVDQLSGSAGKATEGVESLADQTKRLEQEFNDATGNISDLNGALVDLSQGKALNAQKVAELIKKYPELQDKVRQAKDGWIIEKGAVELVRDAQVELAVKTVQSQEIMSNAVLQQSSDRIDRYGIEIEKIIDVQSAMNELNKLPFGPLTADDQAMADAVMAAGKKAEETKKLFHDLYSDKGYGQSNSGSSSSSSKKDPLQESFDAFRKQIEHLKAMDQLTEAQELKRWQNVKKTYAGRQELAWQVEEKIHSLEKKLLDEKKKVEKDAYSESEKTIAHKKAMGILSAREELGEWVKLQKKYKEGTDERMKADEQVYALKKSLMQEEQKNLDNLMKKETDYLKSSRQAALQKIEDERQAYLNAVEEKIRAIDRQLDAEKLLNEDDDYERKLAEKEARLALLQSAVGPDGIKERKDLEKEIAQMKVDRARELRKRDLESQKQALEDEKRTKEEAWAEEKKQVEKRYDDLLQAFDDFKNDAIDKAELLKHIQIMKESEKNAEILKNLDTFVAMYNAKLKQIAGFQTQEERDLQEYNNNKDLYDAAKLKGDAAEMARLNARNAEIRKQYGITKDTGKLQHFSGGGVVRGVYGESVPVIAHAGEVVLNAQQQDNLFRLLEFRMPQIHYSMPKFAMDSGRVENVTNRYDLTVSTGDVNLGDDADVRTFWSERDSMIRRFQARSGGKQR